MKRTPASFQQTVATLSRLAAFPRGRMLLLTILVAIPALVAGWCSWTAPRRDPRLVGMWIREAKGLPIWHPCGFSLEEDGSFRFFRDENVHIIFVEGPYVETTEWRIRSHSLEFHRRSRCPALADGSWQGIAVLTWEWITNSGFWKRAPWTAHTRWGHKIISVSDNQLILDESETGFPWNREPVRYTRDPPPAD